MTDGIMDDGMIPGRRSKMSGKKLVLFIVLPLLLLMGTAAGLYFTGTINKLMGGAKEAGHEEHAAEAPAAAAPAHGAAEGGKKGEGKETPFFDLPDMLVNLNTGNRKTSFLKISVSLELAKAEDAPRLQSLMPRVIDTFQTYLRELRVEDLRGSAGLYRLREELLSRVNAAVAPAKVNDVLFREMLIQ
ncbi:MAG TPA: flagellar basal body-associated FliL family protein [Stellaceae bacterium]|nr:flagellar basal body-associated FliL family protein [Stellaceae bacterium]